MFYVYRTKGPVREFTDDYIRDKLQAMEPQQAWDIMEPLTQLGISLGKLDADPLQLVVEEGRVSFMDKGQGIPDVELAMTDGYTSKKGMGIGLPGAKRLVNEFALTSTPADGTCVTIVRWKM